MLVERMLFCMFHFVQGRRLARRLRTCVCARVPKKGPKLVSRPSDWFYLDRDQVV